MLIRLKRSIKTTFILLFFIAGGTCLYAGNSLIHNCKLEPKMNCLSISGLSSLPNRGSYLLEDTVKIAKGDTVNGLVSQIEKIEIPNLLAGIQINFRINDFVNYVNSNNFIKDESKEMFFQAWFKEKELKRLLIKTDSLRAVYANASSAYKEDISTLILKAEQKLISLNEEIPATYQKAREEEDRYWKTASPEEIAKFQEKIRLYNDSIVQISGMLANQKATIHPEVSDTIVLYKPSPKTTETKAVEPSGIVYKIQIGAYKGRIPEPSSKLLKKLSMIRKVEKYIDDKGVTIYTTGSLKLYQEALTMQNQVKQEGIKNAIIIAYFNEKLLSVSEARKLNNEL